MQNNDPQLSQKTINATQQETINEIITNMRKVFELEDRYLDNLNRQKLTDKNSGNY
jgi:hypothetical protein